AEHATAVGPDPSRLHSAWYRRSRSGSRSAARHVRPPEWTIVLLERVRPHSWASGTTTGPEQRQEQATDVAAESPFRNIPPLGGKIQSKKGDHQREEDGIRLAFPSDEDQQPDLSNLGEKIADPCQPPRRERHKRASSQDAHEDQETHSHERAL